MLLLEARGRVGGQAWTAEVDGHGYEMGGTWTSWCQPFVFHEIKRYGLDKDIVASADPELSIPRTLLVAICGTKDFTSVSVLDILRWWALGRRGFIDGAIEERMRAAHTLAAELESEASKL